MKPLTFCLIVAAITVWAVLTFGEIRDQAKQASAGIARTEQQLNQLTTPNLTPDTTGEPQAWQGEPCTLSNGQAGKVMLSISDGSAQCDDLATYNAGG